MIISRLAPQIWYSTALVFIEEHWYQWMIGFQIMVLKPFGE